MVFAVALRYPNGRTAEAVITSDQRPEQGTTFEMYGHTWMVSGLLDTGRFKRPRRAGPKDEETRILCVCVT